MKLTSWAADGSLGAAAREALALDGEPAQLTALISQWAAGDFSGLPPIEVVQASVLPGAAGAYAINTGTIYLNADWLRFASGTEVLDVLNEELGHHLDGLMNPSDTPGDEGAIFAALVRAEGRSAMAMAGLKTENDQGWLAMDGLEIGAEFSNPTVSLILTSPTTVTEDGPQNLSYVFSRNGDTSNSLTVNFSVGGSATFNSDYEQRGATSFTTTTGSVTFAAGSSVVILSLDPSSDLVSDGDETVALTLAAGTGYAVGNVGAVTGTILDNDVAPGTVVRGTIAKSGYYGTQHEYSNRLAFAALKSDGSVVTWGESSYGGDSSVYRYNSQTYRYEYVSSVNGKLASSVTQIFSNLSAFAALKGDGSVVTWGDSWAGGDSSSVSSSLASGVTQIFSTGNAFAALKSDGSVVTWGDSDYGWNSSSVSSRLASGVTQIFSTSSAFAALKSDGSVVTWGHSDYGGNSSSVSSRLASGVTQIFSSGGAFAALKSDGSVVTWGYSLYGWESIGVASLLTSGVVTVADPFNDDRLVPATTTTSTITLFVRGAADAGPPPLLQKMVLQISSTLLLALVPLLTLSQLTTPLVVRQIMVVTTALLAQALHLLQVHPPLQLQLTPQPTPNQKTMKPYL